MSTLVEHARRELELCGQYEEDPAYAQSILAAVAAFASYGHSGGSAGVAIGQLHALLQYRTLSPINNDPQFWMEVGEGMWQSTRDGAAFSTDGGQTWYFIDDRDATTSPDDDGQ